MSTVMDFAYLVKKERIDLSFNGLHDGNIEVLVEVLEKSDVLKELNLWANRIELKDDNFTNALASNTSIRVLSLGSNMIGGEGGKRLAAAVKANKSLKEIHLGSNRIGEEGGKAFGDALLHNKSLQMLSAYENAIGDAGALAIADAFKMNQTLRVVWLHENKITDDGARAMAEALRGNFSVEKLFLLGNKGISKAVEKEIQDIVADLKTRKKDVTTRLIAQKDEEISNQSEIIAAKDTELASKDADIAALRDELSTKVVELAARDKEIASLKAALATLGATMTSPSAGPAASKDAGAAEFEDARDDSNAMADVPLTASLE